MASAAVCCCCRCAIVRFTRVGDQDILSRLLLVCEKEKVSLSRQVLAFPDASLRGTVGERGCATKTSAAVSWGASLQGHVCEEEERMHHTGNYCFCLPVRPCHVS